MFSSHCRNWNLSLLACTAGLILGLSVNGLCQAGRGKISGLVTDTTGAIIPAATVSIVNTETGVTRTATTTGSGLYSFLSLVPGNYKLSVSKQGFQTVVHTNVGVSVDQTTSLNVTLQPGAVHQEVTVTAAPPLTATTSSTIGTLITASVIDRVPLVDRDVYKLVQLSPGITPTNGAHNNVEFNSRPGADVSAFSINGQPQGTLVYLLDGSPLTIPENNVGATIPDMIPPQDLVQEYRVETSNLPATYQSTGAGVISLVSKSGTNKFHGDGFIYVRPDFWAANDPFVKASQAEAGQPDQAPAFHRYQWGGSIGGPIRHDKTFFFADYEGTTQRSLDNYTTTVPTAAERTGDFSADTGYTIYNPFDLVNGVRQPFSNNQIPTNLLNPIALAYAQQYPAPNRAGTGAYHVNNYFDSALAPDDEEKFDIRIDDDLSDRQRLFGRFSFGRLKFGNANHFHNAFDPNNYQNTTNNRNVLLADDFSLTSNSLLELRYSFTRHYENQLATPAAQGFDPTKLGFPSYLLTNSTWQQIPRISIADNGFEITPDEITGLGASPWTTFHFATQQHDFIAALSTIKGRHNLKFGFEFTKMYMNVGQPIAPEGWFAFDGEATSSAQWNGDGNAFADFLLGMGNQDEWQNAYTKDAFVAEANPYYASYVQDDWRITSRLTLNLGLRWDIFGGRTERHNRLEWFDPSIAYQVNGVNLKGGEQFVKRGSSAFSTNLKNFGPRFGLVYQVRHNMVVRGGFGIFYGPSTNMVANSNINSDGFYPSTFWQAAENDASGNNIVMTNSLSNPFPNGIFQGTGSSLGPATNLGATLTTALRTQPEPSAYDFNFGLDYQLPKGYVVSAAWVGSRGVHLHQLNALDLNTLSLAQIEQYQTALDNSVPNPYVNAITDPTAPLYGATTVSQCQALAQYPQFSNGVAPCGGGVGVSNMAIGDSIYHSLQTKLEKRMTRHFTTLTSFSWSKTLSDIESPLSFIGSHAGTTFQDWRDRWYERSVSSQDVSWWLSWQMSYDLPVGRDRALNLSNSVANGVLGGWTVNNVVSLGGGVPVVVSPGFTDQYLGQRPNLTCDPAKGAPHTSTEWFLPNCFAQPSSPFVPGTSPRTLSDVRAQGTRNWDASLSKRVKLGESRNLDLTFSAYNLTNSVQLGIPFATWYPASTGQTIQDANPTFGNITYAASTPRQFQFSARFQF